MANPMYLFPDPLDIYWIHILPRVDSTGISTEGLGEDHMMYYGSYPA